MGGLFRKLRSLLSLSALGGVIGAGLGALYQVGVPFLGLDLLVFESMGWAVGLLGGFGAAAAGGVGVLLATIDARDGLAQLSTGRAAVCGAVVGLLAPFGFAYWVTGGFMFYGAWTLASLSGLLGAGLGAGFVGMAKRADRLGLGDDLDALMPWE